MPELPEVEHERKLLHRWLRGATIERARVVDARILDEGQKPSTVVKRLGGRKVLGVDRRGKWMRIRLDEGLLFSHLGMTGHWSRTKTEEPVRFAKVELEIARRDERSRVVYSDARLFGRFVIAREDIPSWTELGPDPLHDGIDPDHLHTALSRRRIAVKPVLLDQTVLAGIGNIQATEALYFAKIDPRRSAATLNAKETVALAKGLRKSIDATFAQQGAEPEYIGSGAENPFTIYGREGTPCPRCKRPLAKIVLAGRGTVFCGHCQK